MPRGDPFSRLCQTIASLALPVAADLHTHTNASDGDYTPSQVLAFAQAAKLKAVAITDHDTLAGFDSAIGHDFRVQLIPGVELSTRWRGRDTHVLGLGFDPQNAALRQMLERQCELRAQRFRGIRDRLAEGGIELPVCPATEATPSLGRRHLAKLLVRGGHARNLFDAFQRFLIPLNVSPCGWIDVAEGIRILRQAGGLVALAHPAEHVTLADLAELQLRGLNAIETAHPSTGASRRVELERWAAELGLTCTGGSDCHGPGGPAIGSHGLRIDPFLKSGLHRSIEFAGRGEAFTGLPHPAAKSLRGT